MHSVSGQSQPHPLQGVPAPRAVCSGAPNSAVLLDHRQRPSSRPQSHHPGQNALFEPGFQHGLTTKLMLLQVTAGQGHGAESKHPELFSGGGHALPCPSQRPTEVPAPGEDRSDQT